MTTDAPTTDAPTTSPPPELRGGEATLLDAADVEEAMAAATSRIAPLWELENFVAVNPYLGLADLTFEEAARRLRRVAGAIGTLPESHYLDALASGGIDRSDLVAALEAAGIDPTDEEDPVSSLPPTSDGAPPVALAVDTAAACSGRDWSGVMVERIGAWAAAHFDRGQAIWRSSDRGVPPFESWRWEAELDRTPEVLGLTGFRRQVSGLPPDPLDAVRSAVAELGVPAPQLEEYLHALLLRVGGWSGHAARHVWESVLEGREDDTLVDFLAVLVCWDLLVLKTCRAPGLEEQWALDRERKVDPAAPAAPDRALILHDAFERANRRRLLAQLGSAPATEAVATDDGPIAQAVFCIDVRSEVLRRHLESVDPGIETIGFAGFFGVPIEFRPLGHEVGVDQCPVLLRPGHVVDQVVPDPEGHRSAVEHRRLVHHVRRAWKSFKMGAVSCFSFVGPVGLIYLPKLFSDSFGRTRPVPSPESEGLPAGLAEVLTPSLDPGPGTGIAAADRGSVAEAVLRAMSLTDGLAPVVALVGHGASTVNNPYDNGLDCGACGGHTGEANSRVTAAVLNDPGARAALAGRGIHVPEGTRFVAAQHDTTTDTVTWFDVGDLTPTQQQHLDRLDESMRSACAATRRERARRLGVGDPSTICDAALAAEVSARSRDWSQVRPEWGLAGCHSFVAAPRHRTKGLDLAGRTFLHSYDWRADDGFGILELIMTAPMVVASWINLQYFGSTVDNQLFGSGNKTLHNVVGRLGVLEGSGGDLRPGLPWQSLHDGERLQHEPLRLNVLIEAPTTAIDGVLGDHPDVRRLVDNSWISLFSIDDDGSISQRDARRGTWARTT